MSPPARVAVRSRPSGWTSNAIRLIEAFEDMGPSQRRDAPLRADSGERYADTYFCDEWVNAQELDTSAPAAALTEFERSGHWG